MSGFLIVSGPSGEQVTFPEHIGSQTFTGAKAMGVVSRGYGEGQQCSAVSKCDCFGAGSQVRNSVQSPGLGHTKSMCIMANEWTVSTELRLICPTNSSVLAAEIPAFVEDRTNSGQPQWLLQEKGRQAAAVANSTPWEQYTLFLERGKNKGGESNADKYTFAFLFMQSPYSFITSVTSCCSHPETMFISPPWPALPQRAAQVSLQHFL